MKKDRKKNKIEEEVDLSIIKENDLDDTASFTDLMSRKERKKHKHEKEDTIELKEIKDEEEVEFETEELATQIAENKTIEISNEELKEIVNDNDEIKDEEAEISYKEKKESKNIFNTVFISLLIMISIGAFIYAIIYTDFLDKDLYLIINGIGLILTVFNYCLMTITRKKAAKLFTIFNYLLIIGYITFNTLIYFKII